MATVYQNFKQELSENVRNAVEDRTGIIGETLRRRREEREHKKEVDEQVQTVKQTTKKIIRYSATATNIEIAFLQVAKNFQAIAKALTAMPVLLEEALPQKKKKQELEEEQLKQQTQDLPKPEEDNRLFDNLFNLLDLFKKKILKKKPPKKPRKTKGPKGKLGRLKFAGKALGVVGLAAGAYEAREILKENQYGERMAAGEGKLAERAFREKNTDFSQLPLTQQQAQDILAAGIERDIVAFGGRERLEKIAGVPSQPQTAPQPSSDVFAKVQKEEGKPTQPPAQAVPPSPVTVQPPSVEQSDVQPVRVISSPPTEVRVAPPPVVTQPSITVAAPPPAPSQPIAIPTPSPVSPPPPPAIKVTETPASYTPPVTASTQPPTSLKSVVATSDGGVDLSNFNPELEKRVSLMAASFQQQTGKKLIVTSGYRSNEKQKQLWDAKVTELGGNEAAAAKWVARPMPPLGTGKGSPHLQGLAIDINSKGAQGINILAGTRDSPTGWLEKFGLIRPVPGEDWHIQASGTPPSADNPTNPGAPIQIANKDGRPSNPAVGNVQPLPKEPGTGREILSQSQTVAAAKPVAERGQTVVINKTTSVEQITTPAKRGRSEFMTTVG